jgi:hypothetical protein
MAGKRQGKGMGTAKKGHRNGTMCELALTLVEDGRGTNVQILSKTFSFTA